MWLVFGKVSADPAESYVREKLARSLSATSDNGDEGALEERVSGVLAQQLGAPPPALNPQPLSEIAPEQGAEIEARKRCAQMTLLREWPLVEGEKVEEDFFSFLEEPFDTLPARTVALRRRTNMAELYYLFDDVTLDGGNLSFAAPPLQRRAPAPAMALGAGISSIAADLAMKLATSAAGTVGSKVGTLVFETVFDKGGVPDYFDEVYKELRDIVNESLSAHLTEHISGRVNGTVAWLKNTYNPRKKVKNVTREELAGMLPSFVDSLYRDAVYTLMEKNHAKPGLPVFMLAAGIHLTLMQEQALVDPREPNAAESSYATSVKLNAQVYHDHVVKTFKEIVEKRREAVKLRSRTAVNNPRSYSNHQEHYWEDEVSDEKGQSSLTYTDRLTKQTHDGRAEAEASLDARRDEVERQLTEKLGNPNEIAKTWLKVKEHPIPVR